MRESEASFFRPKTNGMTRIRGALPVVEDRLSEFLISFAAFHT